MSDDLSRLLDDGYDVYLRDGYLIVRDVPYATPDRTVARGQLVTAVTFAGNTIQPPADHTIWFTGQTPCDDTGAPLNRVINCAQVLQPFPDLSTNFYFSAKPSTGNYATVYEKVTTYCELLSRWARLIDEHATAQTYPTQPPAPADLSPFLFRDSASSRAGLNERNAIFAGKKVAILGVGGTGSHILDLVAKTWVAEIHLYDADEFLNHNALRAPGATGVEELAVRANKAAHWAQCYAVLRRGVVPHPYHFTPEHITELQGFDMVFLALDDGADREGIIESLESAGLSFIDVGLGVTDNGVALTGTLRVSASTPASRPRLPLGGTAPDEYARNIQIVELNALNAALAVLQWKRMVGFYADMAGDTTQFAYPISDNVIIGLDQ